MHDIPLFPGGASELLAIFRTFLNFWKNQKADELLNMIFENSLPKGYFWWNKIKYEISIFWGILVISGQELLKLAKNNYR